MARSCQPSLIAAVFLTLVACRDTKAPTPPENEGKAEAADPHSPTDAMPKRSEAAHPDCQVTLCLAGAVRRSDGANPVLARMCQNLPGLVQECSGASCNPLFSMFQKEQAINALVSALDKNKDGRVSAQDPPCRIALVGYSWGGVNATEIAKSLLEDPRWGKLRKTIHRMVLLDPFAPHARPALTITSNVEKLWEYRHSVAPKNDCSARAPLGPYVGLPPRCSQDTRCRDYDLSLKETSADARLTRVGHCTIVRATRDALIQNVTLGTDSRL